MSVVKFTKTAVFYDGNFFSHVSNYYQFHHRRRSRISISGLHDFIRQEIARFDGIDARYCQIVDAHYFRGRLKTTYADQRDILLKERSFDDVLLREGVTTHYLPLSPAGEKGVDVWMALEAFELTLLKRYEVCVLVTSDGDFLPLVRKLNSIGTRVMVLGWDFRYTTRSGIERETRTAQNLYREATYPVMMSERIEAGCRNNEPVIQGLFIPVSETRQRRSLAAPFRQSYVRNTETSFKNALSESSTSIAAGSRIDTEYRDNQPDVDPDLSFASVDRVTEDDETASRTTLGSTIDIDDINDSPFEVYSLTDTPDVHLKGKTDANNRSDKRYTGRIHYLRDGFGFITPDTGGENVYFFHADLREVMFTELSINSHVEYTLGENVRGPAAVDVVVLS